jgi:hypothetical protein
MGLPPQRMAVTKWIFCGQNDGDDLSHGQAAWSLVVEPVMRAGGSVEAAQGVGRMVGVFGTFDGGEECVIDDRATQGVQLVA